MNTNEILELCRKHVTTSEQMRELNAGLRQLSNDLEQQRVLRLKRELGIGTRVRIGRITPKALEGVEGKIVRFNSTRTRADIKADKPVYLRFRETQDIPGVPLSCLDPVEG